jgi:hypothetical protein
LRPSPLLLSLPSLLPMSLLSARFRLCESSILLVMRVGGGRRTRGDVL